MGLRVYNTLTKQKEPFEPVTPGKVGIYLCGPTVYKPAHIGHAVGPIIFDIIKRYLEYRGFAVTLVVNITDVDDKLIDEAAANNTTVPELAERMTRGYLASLDELGIDSIDVMPKASEHIGDIVSIIERLIAADAAYAVNGDVYFDVTRDEDYGKLSNRRADEQQGQRDVAGGQKRNPGDFALWKAAKEHEPADVRYDSPWGPGRPGWHIECSAMSMRYLGETFDIHGGGMDLIFPHHENEIAQAETATRKPFAKYWLHNGLTRFNTKKVSKSDKEMADALKKMTLSTLLEQYGGELLRYFVASTHYRRPIEFSENELESKRKGLATFHRLFERVGRICGVDLYSEDSATESSWTAAVRTGFESFCEDVDRFRDRFLESMDDDFNTAAALGGMFEFCTRINRLIEQEGLEGRDPSETERGLLLAATRLLKWQGGMMGLFRSAPKREGGGDSLVGSLMEILIEARAEARKAKQFGIADMIRDRLGQAGITLEDRPDGTSWHR